MNGKAWRMRRIINPVDGRTLILPLDHGLSMGPIQGLVSPADTLARVCRAALDAVVLHKGLVRFLPRDLDPATGLIIHLSAATDLCPQRTKKLVTGVDEALALGADGVSVHINFGGPQETEMLVDLGRVADRCMALGVPLLVMAYLRGGTLAEDDPRGLAVASRACAELGADLVKLPWPSSESDLAEIVSGCPVGVVLAGGSRRESPDFLQHRAEAAVASGAVGLAAGRNVFQAPDPIVTLESLSRIIHPGGRLSWQRAERRRVG